MEKTKHDTPPVKDEEVKPVVEKLYRLPSSGKIAGVCAGLAAYFNMDVTIMRIIFVILTLASGGFGILVYIILAIIMPVRNLDSRNQPVNKDIEDTIANLTSEVRDTSKTARFRSYTGAAIILFGVWLLLLQFFPRLITINWNFIWPSLLIMFGLILITKGRK